MSDTPENTEILEIKDFTRIDGEVIDKRNKKLLKNKKKKLKQKTSEESPKRVEMDFEKEFVLLLEENEWLRMTLLEERAKRLTIEKILNKVLKLQVSPTKEKD